MVSDNVRRIEVYGRLWPPSDILEMMRRPDLPVAEFWHYATMAVYAMGDDKDFMAALDEVLRERTSVGFPQLKATTAQNDPPGAPPHSSRKQPPLMPQLKHAIKTCTTRGLVWSRTAYAVFFCVMQEDYGVEASHSGFEGKMQQMGFSDCTSGALDTAFSRNHFLTRRTEEWTTMGGGNEKKAQLLADAFRKALREWT